MAVADDGADFSGRVEDQDIAGGRVGPPPAQGGLAQAAGMQPSACSHQLRLLRNLGLATGQRDGRSIIYALYDDHVAELLDQAVYHIDHLRLGLSDTGDLDEHVLDATP